MSVRRRRLALVAVPLIAIFVVVAFGVARFLTTENAERDAVEDLLRAEARGDVAAVAAMLDACTGACRDGLAPIVARVRGPGEVKIARLDSGTSYSLGRAEGWTRVVWVRGVNGRPVVQCVRVRRDGGPLTDRSVTLLRLTAPLADNEGSC